MVTTRTSSVGKSSNTPKTPATEKKKPTSQTPVLAKKRTKPESNEPKKRRKIEEIKEESVETTPVGQRTRSHDKSTLPTPQTIELAKKLPKPERVEHEPSLHTRSHDKASGKEKPVSKPTKPASKPVAKNVSKVEHDEPSLHTRSHDKKPMEKSTPKPAKSVVKPVFKPKSTTKSQSPEQRMRKHAKVDYKEPSDTVEEVDIMEVEEEAQEPIEEPVEETREQTIEEPEPIEESVEEPEPMETTEQPGKPVEEETREQSTEQVEIETPDEPMEEGDAQEFEVSAEEGPQEQVEKPGEEPAEEVTDQGQPVEEITPQKEPVEEPPVEEPPVEEPPVEATPVEETSGEVIEQSVDEATRETPSPVKQVDATERETPTPPPNSLEVSPHKTPSSHSSQKIPHAPQTTPESHHVTQVSSPAALEDVPGVLERGIIHFFYRPKVEVHEVDDLNDVQRMYMLLQPAKDHPNRLLVVGKKKLPDIPHRERLWCFVDQVAKDMGDFSKALGGREYETQTRGHRHVEQARPVGRGIYGIVQHGNHTHLVYILITPEKIGEAQQTFGLVKQGSYVFTCKNPEATVAVGRGFQPGQAAEFPQDLQRKFRGRRFMPVESTLLDYPHAEFVLIGASTRVVEELGEAAESLVEEASDDASQLEQGANIEPLMNQAIFDRLHLDFKDLVLEPIETGELV